VRDAIEAIDNRDPAKRFAGAGHACGTAKLLNVWWTNTARFNDDVAFIIPDRAMSAGTIFAMSGDSIHMDTFRGLADRPAGIQGRSIRSCPVLLIQYERLPRQRPKGTIDERRLPALEVRSRRTAPVRAGPTLSINVAQKVLASYKFKNWTKTQTRERQ